MNPVYARLARLVLEQAHGPGWVLGISGAQGSGKSTLAAFLAQALAAKGLSVAVLSLDDVYRTRAERETLAADVHPLLLTRGPPGTHDVALASRTLSALRESGRVALPRFDKGQDDRLPVTAWDEVDAPVDVVVFEGWCLGARPAAGENLLTPVNAVEAERDPDGRWRCYVDAALAGAYQTLWAMVDQPVQLRAPGFDVVLSWRLEQERALRTRLASASGDGRAMSDAEVERFVALYERITRRMLLQPPGAGDVVIDLAADRTPTWRAP